MTNTLTHIHSDDRSELLSGYLDGALDVAARQEAKRTLQDCPACVAELAELRSLQALLRALPAPVPRRSFTIDPATVRPRRLLFPIFRFASLAAAMMLFVVLGIDALSSSGGQSAPAMSTQDNSAQKQAPAAGGAAEAVPDEAFSAQAQSQASTEAPAAAALSAPAPETATGTESADQPIEPMDAPPGGEALAPPVVQATAAAAETFVPPDTLTTEEAGGDASNIPDTVRSSDNAAAETEEFAASTPQSVAPPLRIWRNVAYVLALFVVSLGSAWWWTARRGL
jgi:anti-sigma factor RsiW